MCCLFNTYRESSSISVCVRWVVAVWGLKMSSILSSNSPQERAHFPKCQPIPSMCFSKHSRPYFVLFQRCFQSNAAVVFLDSSGQVKESKQKRRVKGATKRHAFRQPLALWMSRFEQARCKANPVALWPQSVCATLCLSGLRCLGPLFANRSRNFTC